MLNELMTDLLPRLTPDIRLTHQTGPREHQAVAQRYAESGVEARVVPYIDDMVAELADTDLALCRAGAMTLAELAASGTPAILVPFPHATGGHQRANAQAHASAGAAWMIEEHELTPDRAWELIRKGLEDPARLGEMQEMARARAQAGAAEKIVDRLVEMAGDS